jgi:hypothetical protein
MSSDALSDDPETLKAMLLAERVQNERLRQIIKELQRHRFGRTAESLCIACRSHRRFCAVASTSAKVASGILTSD